MKQAEIVLIYDYNYWANRKILAAASKVNPSLFAAPSTFPFGSLRGTLVHILDTEYGWRTLLERAGQTERWEAVELSESDFPTLASIEKRWQDEEASMRAYVSGLTDDALDDVVRYQADGGSLRERPLWHCLYHVVNHGTQHRSEAAAMLSDYAQSPGDMDFTVFMNERK